MRKWLKISLLTVGLIAVALVAAAWMFEKKEQRAERNSRYALTRTEMELLREGDIIMRKGYGMVSNIIAEQLQEERAISHCGIVVKDEDGLGVIHTVSSSISDVDGIQHHSLSQFVRESKPGSIVVVRLRDLEDGSRIGQRTRHFLSQAITFDHKFDLLDSSQFYCSELVWRVLMDAEKVDIFEGRYDEFNYYAFDRLLNPQYFEIILDHFRP
jgi:hypothetical protein